MPINSQVTDGFANLREAMLSYYADSNVQQLMPAPTRVELGIYDELEGEVSEAAEALESVEADGRTQEETTGQPKAEGEGKLKAPAKVRRAREAKNEEV